MLQNHSMKTPEIFQARYGARAARVGSSLPRADALAKVTGREPYACDFYHPDMLWLGVKRAGVPHARLRGIDVAAARELSGVAAVLTHDDVQGSNRQGVVRKDQPVLVDDKVRHAGDAVALVLAMDPASLARALELIRLDLDPLPGVFDLDQALAPGAPLVHEDNPQGNLMLAGQVTIGQGLDALDDCAVVVQEVFRLPRQEHAYLETEAGWALWDPDGGLTITASTQTPFRDMAEVAEALGLERDQVRIKAPYPGGAFGGKDGVSVQSLLGLAALAAPGVPVKIWLDRQESFIASPKRHPARLAYRLGAGQDGTLQALHAVLHYDTGPYDHLGGVVATLGLEHSGGAYVIPHVHLETYAVYTNNPVGGAFRGFGVPQVNAAMEGMMERLAGRLGMDPAKLRQKNILRPGSLTPVGVTLDCSVGLADCLEQAAGHRLWTRRRPWKAAAGPHQRRGVGLALALHGMGYGPVVPDVANAKIELSDQGRLVVYCGVVDMGQGNASTYLQVAGHLLNQDLAHLELVLPDTARTLPSGSSSASRTTFTYGRALLAAAGELKVRLLKRAADMLMVPVEEMTLVPGAVRHLTSGRELSLKDLAGFMAGEERVAVHSFRAPVSPQRPSDDPGLTLHGLPHRIFSFGAQLCGVEVDRLTGRVRVLSLVTFCDVGNVINRQVLEQQVQGGAAQGLGYALWERMRSREGRIIENDLSTYIIPTAGDLPDMELVVVPGFEPEGPFGMKGAGELPTDLPAAAVAAAVADACGAAPNRFPITPQVVLELLHQGAARNLA